MLRLAITLAVLTACPTAISSNAEQTLLCPDGQQIKTVEKGSREQRKNTANLDIEKAPKSFDELPGWQLKANPQSLWLAVDNNCKTKQLPAGWGGICQQFKAIAPADVHAFIERHFAPSQLLVADSDKGKFTSYYASLVNVSRVKSGQYVHPIYRASGHAKNLLRKDIEGQLPESDVLFWADDAFDAYILAIQGSGVGLLPDGSKVKILYDGKNIGNYVSIGKVLAECGEIEKSKISLPTIRNWVDSVASANYQRLISNNQSYVFFREDSYDGASPVGALGVPLTPMRSLAVDTRYIPLGTMAYISVPHPLHGDVIEQAFIAQDKGGAINGGIRADIFAGEGKEAALFAGNMAHYGRLWLIEPKL